jgi:hypothetical protein
LQPLSSSAHLSIVPFENFGFSKVPSIRNGEDSLPSFSVSPLTLCRLLTAKRGQRAFPEANLVAKCMVHSMAYGEEVEAERKVCVMYATSDGEVRAEQGLSRTSPHISLEPRIPERLVPLCQDPGGLAASTSLGICQQPIRASCLSHKSRTSCMRNGQLSLR